MKGISPIGYNTSLYLGLAPIQGIVVDLLSRLLVPLLQYSYHYFMDNLFNTPELFELLRSRGSATTGTARI